MRAIRMMVVLVALSSLLSGCQWLCHVLCDSPLNPEGQLAVFSGQVLSTNNVPLTEASVTVNGRAMTTDDKGFFTLTVDSSSRYLVTIRKRGYSLFSRIYTKGILNKNWRLTRATLTTLDPAAGGIVQDTLAANCLANRSRSGWTHLEVRGNPVSPALRTALDGAYQPAGCSAGVSVDIPADALVDANGNRPPGRVEVEVATVDVLSPEAMPGDWGAQFSMPREGGERLGFMQTFGAGSVSVTAGGKSYQLKPKTTARLTIPVDPTAAQIYRRMEQPLPSSIPLLLYDEKQGIWKQMSIAQLNESRDAYVADLPHFSEWNMDVVFSDVACTQIDSRLISGGYYLKAVPSVIPAGGLQPHEFDIPNTSGCLGNTTGDPFYCYIHAAWRLPSSPAHGFGQVSFMPGTRTGPNPGDIVYNRANFVVPFGTAAPNQQQMPPSYSQHPTQPALRPGSYPNCTTAVTFADKPTLQVTSTATALTFTPSGYWGPNSTIVPNHPDDRYEFQWCNIAANPSCSSNPDDSGWINFASLPSISITGAAVRPARAVTSSPIQKSSLPAGTYKFRARAHMGDSSFLIGGSETPWSDPSITITIGGNSPPTLTSIANQTVNVGTLVALTANGTDPDGNTLTYSLTTAPSGAVINPSTGGFTWTPSGAQGALTHNVTVLVTDNGAPNLSASTSFTVTVNPQVIIENNLAGAMATGCSTPIDGSIIRLQVQSENKLVPLSTDTADGSIPQYGAEGAHIAAGSASSTFNPTATTYTVVIEMGSWTAGGSGGFVQRRYTHDNATDGCTQGRYRYLDFTVTGQGPGPLTLRVQPNGNQYQAVVQGGMATLSTAATGQKTTTDFTRTAGPYTTP